MTRALPTRHETAVKPLDLRVSVVIPVRDEAASIAALSDKVLAALRNRRPFELIYVDDGSRDESPAILRELCARPEIRVIRHRLPAGQSAAVRTGVQAARAQTIVTLDGDGQNDPADIPDLLDALVSARPAPVGLVQGERTRRQDSRWKSLTSRLANWLRRGLLRDGARDSGCGLRAFPRDAYLRLPFFDHLHRFMAAMIKREGYEVVYIPVTHHPRRAGRSHYGTVDRLFAGMADLMGVIWLIRRRRLPETEELDP